MGAFTGDCDQNDDELQVRSREETPEETQARLVRIKDADVSWEDRFHRVIRPQFEFALLLSKGKTKAKGN